MVWQRLLNNILTVSVISILMAIPLLMPVEAQSLGERLYRKRAEVLVEQGEFTSDAILVQTKDSDGEFAVEELVIPNGINTDKYGVAETDSAKNFVKQKLKEKLADPNVLSAQPNYLYSLSWTSSGGRATPDDWNSNNHWYYDKAKLREMWEFQDCEGGANCGGNNSVTVAVIDTGLAYENYTGRVVTSDIAPDPPVWADATFLGSVEYSGINFHVNALEIPGNELDDDCNGYVDDVNGADVYAALKAGMNTCTGMNPDSASAEQIKAGHPVDNYGHGSIVTGTIASVTDNAAGSVSPAFAVRIMPISANIHLTRNFTSASLVEAVNYAHEQGADVINMSLGSTAVDPALQSALTSAYNDGISIVASSGNEGSTSNPTQPIYPASYSNVISVGAVNNDDTRSSYSSYGSDLDVTAYVGEGGFQGSVWQVTNACYPSCTITNLDDNAPTTKNAIGTSFAAPQVSALAAMIRIHYPSLNNAGILSRIVGSAKDINAAGYDSQTGWGVINYYDAIAVADLTPQPEPVYRFLNKQLKIHFYTASAWEKNYVQTTLANNWQYEFVAFNAYNRSAPTTKPVYRFLHKTLKIHFYTASEWEKNFVITNLGGVWEYERVAYYAAANSSGHKPVYRFLHKTLKIHFYTASEWEKNFVQTQLSGVWQYEMVAYYVPN